MIKTCIVNLCVNVREKINITIIFVPVSRLCLVRPGGKSLVINKQKQTLFQ